MVESLPSEFCEPNERRWQELFSLYESFYTELFRNSGVPGDVARIKTYAEFKNWWRGLPEKNRLRLEKDFVAGYFEAFKHKHERIRAMAREILAP